MQHWLIPFRHNRWATRIMLDACRSLSDEQFHRRFEMGCGSLHDTFVHIVGAMSRWADRIGGAPLGPSAEDSTRRSIDELIEMLDTAAEKLERSVSKLVQENRADEMMEFPNEPGQPPFRFHRATAMVHITTHGMHHRAQALNMLRQIGVDPLPEIDVIEWEIRAGYDS